MRTRRIRPDPIPRSAFAGFSFPPDVIVLAVRWYLRFGLSYRDVEELLAERGVEVDHGRLKSRLRPMRGLKQDRRARVVIAGHAFVQNLRRAH
jgi:transposase-like protein